MESARNPHLLTLDDLRQWTGFDSPAAIRRRLEQCGIWYMEGKDGPVTTLGHIEKATKGTKLSSLQPMEFVNG